MYVFGKLIVHHFAQQFGEFSGPKLYYSHDISLYDACVIKDGKSYAAWKNI
jgi:hypothetical protein